MNKTASAILKAGFIAGSLDILLAFADAWWSAGILPMQVLRFIASGIMGQRAFQHSYDIALLSVAIHFFIVLFWTALFFIIYRPYRKIIRSPFLQSAFYGLFVWLVMNILVLPFTHVPGSGFQWWGAIKGIVILMIAIGWPLVYFARKNYAGKLPNDPTKA